MNLPMYYVKAYPKRSLSIIEADQLERVLPLWVPCNVLGVMLPITSGLLKAQLEQPLSIYNYDIDKWVSAKNTAEVCNVTYVENPIEALYAEGALAIPDEGEYTKRPSILEIGWTPFRYWWWEDQYYVGTEGFFTYEEILTDPRLSCRGIIAFTVEQEEMFRRNGELVDKYDEAVGRLWINQIPTYDLMRFYRAKENNPLRSGFPD